MLFGYLFITQVGTVLKFGYTKNPQIRISQYSGLNRPSRIILLEKVDDGIDFEINMKKVFTKYKDIAFIDRSLGTEWIRLNAGFDNNEMYVKMRSIAHKVCHENV